MWRNAALDPSQEADLSQCCINYSCNYIIYTISSMILVKVRGEISHSSNQPTRGMGAQYYCQQPQVLIEGSYAWYLGGESRNPNHEFLGFVVVQ